MNLKELIHQANQLVQDIGPEINTIIEKHDFKGNVDQIISFIKANRKNIEEASDNDLDSLKAALSKRRPISLQATHAALHKLLIENKLGGNILDNLESNLQSEKSNRKGKGKGMADSEELSQDDIEALLAGNDTPDSANEDVSNDDIDALLNEANIVQPEKSSKEDDADMSQDDIEALLNGMDTPKDAPSEKPAVEEDNLSQDDIEALLGGGATDTEDAAEMSQDEIEALLAGNDLKPNLEESRVESDQISEEDIQNLVDSQNDDDDIQALLNAQEEQDHSDPLISALEDDSSENGETRIPQDVFPASNLADILAEGQTDTPVIETDTPIIETESAEIEKDNDDYEEPSNEAEKLISEVEKVDIVKTPKPKEPVAPVPQNKRTTDQKPTIHNQPETTYREYEVRDKDVSERVLQDIFALYVNSGGKPILQAECNTKEEIKKAYLMAMQSFPQNALFIEKISRKEIVVIKESKEIINLKINVSFE